MLTFDQCKNIAFQSLPKWDVPGDELILLENQTIEKPFGWIFFYTSKLWYETDDMKHAIAGNSPLFVSKYDGEVKTYPSAFLVEQMIQLHESFLSMQQKF